MPQLLEVYYAYKTRVRASLIISLVHIPERSQDLNTLKMLCSRGPWLAQVVERAALDLGAVGSSPTMDIKRLL